ncbi:MAG TPA: YfiR family protein [Pseudoxanthomonas sp.]|nr:YfiR family protein [Pseudoxanthomonas sp.]
MAAGSRAPIARLGAGMTASAPSMLLGLLLWMGIAAPFVPLTARAAPLDETTVHAAYVINFVRYSRWPRLAPGAPLVIATLGGSEAAEALRGLASRAGQVEGHPLEVRPLALARVPPSLEEAMTVIGAEAADAQLVFVDADHRAWNRAVIAALAGRPVLTVGMGSEFVAGGGMFGLVNREGRVVFTANKEAIARNPVDVSARVLMLARPLEPGGD